MKDAKGHGSNKRGFDGDKRFGNSAIEGHGVNSPAMMEARARAKAIAYGDSRQTPNATPLDVIRASHDYEAARELARGSQKSGTVPVHAGAIGRSDRVTILHQDGEYAVPNSASGKTHYFTNDKADAESTARKIHGHGVAIKHRSKRWGPEMG